MDNGILSLAVQMMTQGKQNFSYYDKKEDRTYNFAEATTVLRNALIEANGGSDKFNYKNYRRNKVQIFEIIEELVPVIIEEGLKGDEFFMNFVEERNLALGDDAEFYAPDNTTFIVTKIARGIATPDRQRLDHGRKVTVSTAAHAVRAYEEFARFMAGRIDWPALCAKVAKSFMVAIWEDIFTAFSGIDQNTLGLSNTYVKAGTFTASDMNALIEHVEAATGERAVLIGTKAALAKCEGSEKADSAKESMHNAGFYGMFDGTPMVMIHQQHKSGTEQFLFDDSVVYVVAASDKFIKLVHKGETIVDDRDFTENSDMTIEYRMIMEWGVALLITGKIGKYTITA